MAVSRMWDMVAQVLQRVLNAVGQNVQAHERDEYCHTKPRKYVDTFETTTSQYEIM